jgi:hypothetical protein
VNLSSPSQPLGLGLGLSVNVSLSVFKLGVRLHDKGLWINGKLQMMILICGRKNILGVSKATYGYKGLEGICQQNQCIIP